jgi:alkanesulfonate monooxygenase SsuD/methylene tetrahydromethanopterin reductase-like flavin-dependent oxidoreductase (luciferase family)
VSPVSIPDLGVASLEIETADNQIGGEGRPYDRPMQTDLVLVPFDSAVPDIVAAARAADEGGFDTVWTYDHFSGLVVGAGWSRDPLVALGAIAATTERIGVGTLVANAVNRHPAQLACAINSLQSLAPGRVRLGIGAGSSPGSPFAAEHRAIDRPLADTATRRALLAETIDAVRALWRGEAWHGSQVSVAASMAVTDGAEAPPIIVGAGHRETIRVACDHADGVNLLPGDDLAGRVAFAREHAATGFEVSVFTAFERAHPLGGDPAPLFTLGVDRRTLYVGAPFPTEAITRVGAKLDAWNQANG